MKHFPKVIFSSFIAWCPSFFHTKYHGTPPLLKFHNTCVCGQNLSIARLFYSHALTILRDFRFKKIFSSSELRVWSIGGMMLTGETKRNQSHSRIIVDCAGLDLGSWFYGYVTCWPNTLLHATCDKCLERSPWKAVGYPPCCILCYGPQRGFFLLRQGYANFSKNLGCFPELWFEAGITVTRRRGPKYSHLGYVGLKIYVHPVLPVLFQPHRDVHQGMIFLFKILLSTLVFLRGKVGDLLKWHKRADFFLYTVFFLRICF
jgi:hypothetical protein